MSFRTSSVLIAIAVVLAIVASAGAGTVGINYGRKADNLPPASKVVQLIKSQGINKLKLYDADPAALHAFSGTDIKITIALPNEELSNVARRLSRAYAWVQKNVVAYVPGTQITAIAVGNEVFAASNDLTSYLVPAMKNIHMALVKYNLDGIIKVSSPLATSVLQNSFPPSAGLFKSDLVETTIKPMLDFLSQTGSSLMVNVYPFFAYEGDANDISLDYALFRPNAGVRDSNTGLLYTNLFDAQLDAVFSAMSALGYKNLDIVVSETGWPSKGDEGETGANLDNAAAYNGNLVKHVLSNSGTPLRPKASLDTFIFALFNENQKPGPTSERNYGLFYPTEEHVYSIALTPAAMNNQAPTSGNNSSSTPATSVQHHRSSVTTPVGASETWCVANSKIDTSKLQAALDYACGEGAADCKQIQPGASCYNPNTLEPDEWQCMDKTSCSKLLIKGGTVVNADRQQLADVYIEDGVVIAVQPNIKVADEVRILDATGKYVMPGGIDPHTHLAFPFMGQETVDDFFSGQAAALAGGTTMHIDFVIPINGSLSEGFESYAKKAEKSCMDYGFHMAVTTWNEGVARDMEILVKEKGINSFKFFMAYKGELMVKDELLLQGFKMCKALGAIALVHAENGEAIAEGQSRMIELGITGPEGHALSRPSMLEGEATARAIRLAQFVNTPLYVVHVMSIDALDEIVRARQSGLRVIGEPIVASLVLDGSKLWDPDFRIASKYVMSPPIRESGHNKALQAALSTGLLQLVGTDHCPFNSTQKAAGINDFRKIPNGVNGIEERMHLIWDVMVNSGQISVMDYVRITSTACAQIFNLYPRKGAILPNSDADIIILNPNATFQISAKSHHSKIDTNVYEGWEGKGKVEVTISRGKVVWEDDKLMVEPGSGRYISMPPFGYLFHGMDKMDAAYLSSLKAPVYREVI